MKLRKECDHGKYDGHRTGSDGRGWCPGGVFLPDLTGIDRAALAAALEWYADMAYLDAKDASMVDAARFVLTALDGETP